MGTYILNICLCNPDIYCKIKVYKVFHNNDIEFYSKKGNVKWDK